MNVTTSQSPPSYRSRVRPSAAGEVRVLLAEDDDELRTLIAYGLRAHGIKVSEARNGKELLDYLHWLFLRGYRETSLDVVVTDVEMPGANGLDILSGLRRAEWATPVILVTAFPEEHVLAEAERLGAVAVLEKPFDMGRLAQLVADAARQAA